MYKRLLKDTAIYGFSDFSLKILAFISFPIFTHLLSLNDYGVLSLVASIAGFAGIFLNIGINNAVQRYYFNDEFKGEEQRVRLISTGYFLLLGWSIVVSILFIGSAFFFKDYLQNRFEILWIYLFICLLANLPLQLMQYSCDTLRLHFAPWRFTFLSGIKNLSGILLSIVLLSMYKFGLVGYFWANLIAPLMFFPLGIILIKKELRWNFDIGVAKKILKFGYPFLYAGIAYWLFSSLDRWMLAEMSSIREVGIYSVAMKFGLLMFFVGSAFGQAWSPYALKIHSEKGPYQEIFGNILSYYFFILVLIGSVLCLFIKEFLILFTPQDFWGASQSAYFLTMGVLLYTTTYVTQIGISINNKTNLLSIISWGATVLNFILNYFMIPYYGSLGASIATFITYLALSLVYLFFTQRIDPIVIHAKRLIVSLVILLVTIQIAIISESDLFSINSVVIKILYIVVVVFVSFKLKLVDIFLFAKIFK